MLSPTTASLSDRRRAAIACFRALRSDAGLSEVTDVMRLLANGAPLRRLPDESIQEFKHRALSAARDRALEWLSLNVALRS